MRTNVIDIDSDLVGRQVKSEQDGLQALFVLHLVDLIGRPQVELAQIRHSAVGSPRNVLP